MVMLRALLVSAFVFVASGCGQAAVPSGSVAAPSASRAPTFFPLESETPAPTPQPLAIVSIETRGGECPNGACGRLVNVEGDGTLHEVIPTDRVLGTVPEPLLDALRIEIEQANYPLLQSRPFTGECPTAFDGQETIYTFHATTGDEVFASCTVAIDPHHPLFRALAAALAAAGAL
ncbi:MAG: hypothetical protein M3Q66_06960 [Chloroflexota bacterium]|nr:hypothetical protein [Chloroflexota bacterium]